MTEFLYFNMIKKCPSLSQGASGNGWTQTVNLKMKTRMFYHGSTTLLAVVRTMHLYVMQN